VSNKAKYRLPADVVEALEATGQPWHLQNGKRHVKLIVGGRLASVLSHGRQAGFGRGRETPNTIAQIRRVARALSQQR
jgi:hypothetical protein